MLYNKEACTKFVNIQSRADAREGYIYINHIERDGALIPKKKKPSILLGIKKTKANNNCLFRNYEIHDL